MVLCGTVYIFEYYAYRRMDLISIIFIALGLSMDAIAVAMSLGLSIKSLKIQNGFVIGLFFGGFQAIMPVIGWSIGLSLKDLITSWDHWLVFGLLAGIGIKMIYESVKIQPDREEVKDLKMSVLVLLSLATSIDALAIGISFAVLRIAIITPVLIIGFVTFLLSFLGVGFGRHAGHLFQRKIETVGGVILILIGVKIVLEHLL
jgi:manganese efflux pump family protein